MNTQHSPSRRVVIRSSIFGVLVASIPNIVFARNLAGFTKGRIEKPKLASRYPSIDDAVVSEVVGVSHFDLARLKVLVDARPELARATWDWGFGDWESALGAASHVGRRDIASYLISKGARPDIFWFAMLGDHDVVKAMITAQPGIQAIAGPHGISLLQHAKNGHDASSATEVQKKASAKLIEYLEGLGNADVAEKYTSIEESEKTKYLGDYMYGDGPADGFSIKLNSKKNITLGKPGKFGAALHRKAENVFMYNGAPSVEISFAVENNQVISLTVQEPGMTLTAKKI